MQTQQNQQRHQLTKRHERATMAELKEQREASTTQHRDPEWVTQYWKQVTRS